MAISGGSSQVPPVSRLWSIKAPPRVVAFGWLAIMGKILIFGSVKKLQWMGVSCVAWCNLLTALLINCKVSQRLWILGLEWQFFTILQKRYWSCCWVSSKQIVLHGWGVKIRWLTSGRVMWRVLFLVIMKTENSHCFQGSSFSMDVLREERFFCCLLGTCPLVLPPFHDFLI